MLKSTENVAPNRQQLEIEIGAEVFGEAVSKAFRNNAKKLNVPGFRRGKAPRGIIEKLYGEDVFYEDAFNLLYSDAVDEAMKESGLEFIEDKVDFDLVSITREDGVLFKVTMTTKPEVEIGEYKGLKAEKPSTEVTPGAVDEEIERLRDRNSRLINAPDRAAETGDTAVIDYEGLLDGVPFEGGTAQGHSLKIGSGQFIPGFEEQVAGHSVNDEFDVNVTFPDDYHSEELAGKAVIFKVKLHEIKTTEKPDADDEFAKDVSEFDTIAELRADFEKKIAERLQQESDSAVENQLFDELVKGLKAEIPEAMFERRIDESVRDFGFRLQSQGLDLDTYIKYMGGDKDGFRNSFRETAENQVKTRLALEKIVKLENIVPSEDDLNAEYAKIAESHKMDIDAVKKAIPAEELAADVAVTKAVDLIKAEAVITDKAPEAKAPTKKSAPKKTAAKAGDKAADKAGDKAGDKAAAKTTDKAEKASEKPAAKTASKAPAKSAEKPAGAKKPAAAKAQEKPEEKSEAKPAAKKAPAKKPAAKKPAVKDDKAE